MKKIALVAAAAALVTGCGTTNNYLTAKTKTVEYYRIFDIKTDATRQKVSKAASDGLGKNVGSAQEFTPIPSSGELPDQPGRFKLVNPYQGSQLAALAALSGQSTRAVNCDGASWTAKAQRSISGQSDLFVHACLFPYKGGYHLDLYATFTKQEGGLMQISRDMASAMVGTPEEWTEKTFLDTVRKIREVTGAEVQLLEAQPELSGTPWLDSGESAKK